MCFDLEKIPPNILLFAGQMLQEIKTAYTGPNISYERPSAVQIICCVKVRLVSSLAERLISNLQLYIAKCNAIPLPCVVGIYPILYLVKDW